MLMRLASLRDSELTVKEKGFMQEQERCEKQRDQ